MTISAGASIGSLQASLPLDPLENRILLCHALGISRVGLITQSERELSADEAERLAALVPPGGSRANPVNLLGDAEPERYRQALEILLQDKGVDAVLVIHSPTATVDSAEIARAIAPLARCAVPAHLSQLGGAQGLPEPDALEVILARSSMSRRPPCDLSLIHI